MSFDENDPNNSIVACINRSEEIPPGADDEELAYQRRNDYGNAMRLIARHGYDMMHVDQLGWIVWDGKSWKIDSEAEALKKAHLTAEAIFEEAEALPAFDISEPEDKGSVAYANWEQKKEKHEQQKRGLKKWALQSGNNGKVKAMVDMAAAYLNKSQDDLDQENFSLSVENGTLRLGDDIKIFPHSRQDYITKCANVEYDKQAAAPKWEKFVAEVLPDPKVAKFVQAWLGYCLTGDVSEQKIVTFEGKGANGKSTLLEVVARILGNYSATTPIETFLHNEKNSGSGPSPDIARLPGIRLVRASEPEPGCRLSESRIKQFTGGEKLTARHLHRDFFEFSPQGKLTLSVNIRPVLVGKDHGIRRRILVVPFTQTFVSAKQKKRPGQKNTLTDKLLKEAPGILNWLLDGFRIYWEEGLEIPEAVKEATEAYFTEMDPIGSFIAEACEQTNSEEDRVTAKEIYEAYRDWCKASNEAEKSQSAFGKRLGDLGIMKKRVGGKVYRTHVNFRQDWQQQSEFSPEQVV